jgi:hypothetical protein
MTFTRRFPNWVLRRRRTAAMALVLAAACMLLSQRARAQFGLDPCCAIISAGLNTVSGLLKNVVGKPLSAIDQLRRQAADFERQVVYPAAAIDSARQGVAQLEGSAGQMTRLAHLPLNSATLPAAQQLESSLLSRDPQVFAHLSANYVAVYGSVMPASDASDPIRNLVDAGDAEALAALKKAVALDALADVELSTATELSRQLENAAPGTAPLLQAEAASWVVRADAYTQSAVAELLRVRSTALAARGAQMKLGASDLDHLRRQAGNVLAPGAH